MKRLILIIGFLICAVSIFAQETYKLTGELKVKRSESAKKEFLKSKGLKKILQVIRLTTLSLFLKEGLIHQLIWNF